MTVLKFTFVNFLTTFSTEQGVDETEFKKEDPASTGQADNSGSSSPSKIQPSDDVQVHIGLIQFFHSCQCLKFKFNLN